MYSELIYTRCRQGIDILKAGRPITSDGYKVYSCTSSLLENNNNDLQFLLNAAQAKQPYSDPSLMDDAYLYFVPDKGESFMVDFYPVPYDANAKGNYSHRAGNFVNHILIGDYSEFYPFELFRNSAVWNAKARGEAYYYENAPTDLLPRNDISKHAGQFGIEEIGAFISDGRKEALMNAVSFLITQYELPPEERKFLVIRDESSEKIEMWIAAIEQAFSPRMAAGIPFATRMDKFVTTNRYTVNQMGFYQTQIDLQDRNQKLRYRAMIVGVDERDRINDAASRPLANSPFVLLDGKEKRAMFEADTSNRYFRFITSFNDAHQSFCREFLQMINFTTPNADIFRLLDIFITFDHSVLPNAENTGRLLATLGKYPLINTSILQSLYTRITAELPRYLQEDPRSALQIIKWLQSVSRTINDANATSRLSEILCKGFADYVYRKSDPEGTFDFWQNVRNSEFAKSVAGYFVDQNTLQNDQANLHQLKFADAITFALIYLDCAAFIGTVNEQYLQSNVNWGLRHCYSNGDTDAARKILKTLSQNRRVNVHDMLFSIARTAEKEYAEFIVKFLIEYNKNIVSTDAAMVAFLKKLSTERMEHLYSFFLKFRAQALYRPVELEQMIKLLPKLRLSDDDLSEIFTVLDQKIRLTDKSYMGVAAIIQEEKPRTAVCLKSAHLYAITILNDRKRKGALADYFTDLVNQGFPAVNRPDYIRVLNETLLKIQLSQVDVLFIINNMYRQAPQEYLYNFIETICANANKQVEKWNIVINIAAKSHDEAIVNTIADVLSNMKQSEKTLDQLNGLLRDRGYRDYFWQIAEKAKEIIRAKKPQSNFGRLFKPPLKDDDNDSRRTRR